VKLTVSILHVWVKNERNEAFTPLYAFLACTGTTLPSPLQLPYFPTYKMHRPIRRTMIFSLEILEKDDDECILILVMYWKKTGLLHILLQESKLFTSSDARSHDLEANFAISQ
jgi:hypothetical protein